MVLTFISLVGVLLLFVPLESLISVGEFISPLGTIQEKTIILFRYLRIALPVLGMCLFLWVIISGARRRPIQFFISKIISSRWALPTVLVLSCAVRLAWIIFYPTKTYADSEWYVRTASELAAGQGFVYSVSSQQPLAAWPIGYPAFLAALFLVTGPSIFIAKIANIVLSVMCVGLTYYIAERIFNKAVALVAALLLGIMPGMIVYSSLASSDLLFMTMTTLCFAILVKTWVADGQTGSNNGSKLEAFGLGLASGAMSLVRATGLTLFPLWVIGYLIGARNFSVRRRVTWLGLALLGSVVILSPWTIRNYLEFHEFIPVSTNGGANFWIGNNPNAFGGYYFPNNASENPLYSLIGTETVIDKMGYSLGFQFIRENPLRTMQLIPAKLFYLVNSNDFGLHWNRLSAIASDQPGTGNRPTAITNLFYIILVLFSLIGLGKLVFEPNRKFIHWLGVFFVVYWVITCLPFFGQDRFMMPAWPFLATYAAYGFIAILKIDYPAGEVVR